MFLMFTYVLYFEVSLFSLQVATFRFCYTFVFHAEELISKVLDVILKEVTLLFQLTILIFIFCFDIFVLFSSTFLVISVLFQTMRRND